MNEIKDNDKNKILEFLSKNQKDGVTYNAPNDNNETIPVLILDCTMDKELNKIVNQSLQSCEY